MNGKEVNGYVLAKVYEGMAEVGPLVCQPHDEELARGLLARILSNLQGRYVSVYLPQTQTGLLTFLGEAGFQIDSFLSRMFLGSPKIQDCVYIAESLERG